MKPRTVIMTFEITTDLPVKALRESVLSAGPRHCRLPLVNKPRIEVVQASKRKGKK